MSSPITTINKINQNSFSKTIPKSLFRALLNNYEYTDKEYLLALVHNCKKSL